MVKYDKSINDILAEEWLSYYAGDETLDNVLNGIQSRVNLYLQETK